MSSPVEKTAIKSSAWKNRSMNVFMRTSRTQGVGHPRGQAWTFSGLKAELEPE